MKNGIAIVINSEKDTQRREHMENMLKRFEIEHQFLTATQVNALSDATIARYGSPVAESALRSIACAASHISAWKAFLLTDNRTCLVLEDDIRFYEKFDEFWGEFEIPDNQFELWKIESCNATCTVSLDSFLECKNVTFHQLHGSHAATGAYVINRKTARFLVDLSDDFSGYIDHELFDPFKRTVPMCRTLQTVPALCIQDDNYSAHPVFNSTIGDDRNPDKAALGNRLRRRFISPLITSMVSFAISYQGLKRIKINHLPVV